MNIKTISSDLYLIIDSLEFSKSFIELGLQLCLSSQGSKQT